MYVGNKTQKKNREEKNKKKKKTNTRQKQRQRHQQHHIEGREHRTNWYGERAVERQRENKSEKDWVNSYVLTHKCTCFGWYERMLQHECIHNQNGRDKIHSYIHITHIHIDIFNSIKTDMHTNIYTNGHTYTHTNTHTGAHIDNRILFLNGSRALECVSLPKGTILYT